ncbi:MAG TPA: sugar ABC transporter permease [Anaeromyxobacteraceae bacterium]|nr:sugar ABC transporter permease [Anaeromyxobacteraceae bacterium]
MAGRPSHRLRFGVGLALAAGLGVGVSYLLLAAERRQAAAAGEERRAVVATQALAELVERAGRRGEPARRAVGAWQAGHDRVRVARVVALEGISLEASTAPEDQGDKAAPRRLARDEKALYDQGQRLRAAVAANKEGGAPKAEIEAQPLTGGALRLATPVLEEGAVTGMVQIESTPSEPAPRPPLFPAILAFLGPLVLFGLVSAVLGQRRLPLAFAAAACLALGVGAYALHSLAAVSSGRALAQQALAQSVQAEAGAVRAALSAVGLHEAPPLRPGTWDADAYRRPRGLLGPDGKVDEAAGASEAAAARGQAERALWGVAILAMALLLLVGLGGFQKLAATLVANRQAYFYVIPAMVGMLVLVFFPFIYGIALSFTDSNLYTINQPLTDTWIGLRNYGDILGDFGVARRAADGSLIFNYLNFYWTLAVTVLWTVSNVTIGVSVGLLLALILNTPGLAARPLYRVLLILPWAVPNYITALIWKGMFHRQFGVVNHVLRLLGSQGISWFDTPATSFLTALATNGWLSFSFMMVVSLGGLQSIPAELYEAARVDGASRWQRFKAITLPSLKPALVPAVILSVVWTFNMFNVIYLVTAGEPGNSTEILITQAYKFAFERYRYGYAAAYSTIIFGILLAYSAIQNKLSRATEAA